MPFNYNGVDLNYDQYSRSGNAAQYAVQAFQQHFGRAPTASELAKVVPIFEGGDKNITDVSGGNRYVASLFDQDKALKDLEKTLTEQMTKQQTQSDELYTKQQDQLSQALQKQREAASAYYSPGGTGYQGLAGQVNSAGLLDSGAFSEAIAKQLGEVEKGIAGQAATGFAIPSLLNQQQNQSGIGMQGIQAQMYPYMQSIQTPTTLQNRGYEVEDFYRQAELASRLGQMGQPSGFEKGLGYANTASNIYSNLAGNKGTSYVCKELIKRGLLCESDMDDFHVHIMPAMFKKGRAFWKYAMDGYKLVQAVNAKGLDWSVFKPLLFDRVMEETDVCKAVDLYADACHQLCISSDRSLWDERVFQTSVWDSLPFLPLLFAYQPFREALAKSIRVKMLLVYDKPRCEVHRGA